MRRLTVGLAGLFVIGLLTAPVGVDAQSSARVPRVGVLGGGSPPTPSERQGFLDALGRLGYVGGQTIVFEARFAEGHADRLPAFARELVGLQVDLIMTDGTPATRAAREATATIPVVFTVAANPVRNGLVASFARPGGNLTGFAYGIYDDKRLEVLREAIPGLSRVACLCSPTRDPVFSNAVRALRLQVQFLDPRGPGDLDRAFMAARDGRAEAVLVVDSAWITDAIVQRIADLATKSRLPAIGAYRSFASYGGLASYGPAPFQARPRVLEYMDRILKGAKPGDLPVEQPTKFQLVFNVKTARGLGITIPRALLLRADELIE